MSIAKYNMPESNELPNFDLLRACDAGGMQLFCRRGRGRWIFLKGELNPADELRKPFRKKVKKIMYKTLSTLLTTQGLFTERRDMPSSLVKIDRKFKDTKTCFSSLNKFRNVESVRGPRQLLPEYLSADDPPEDAGHRAYCLRHLRRHLLN